MNKQSLIALAGLCLLPAVAFGDKAEDLKDAETAYQQGNCAAVIKSYRKAYYQYAVTAFEKNLILFRTSYCYLQLGQLPEASKGFEKFLQTFPDHDEARLRLAQAYFQQRDFARARSQLSEVAIGSFSLEAILLAAQADIELNDAERAVARLQATTVPVEWQPIFFYWQGVASYTVGNRDRALSYFRSARNLAPDTLWVKKEADAWLVQIAKDNRWFHGSLGLGYFSDGNVGQQSILTVDSAGVPNQPAPHEDSYYKDEGYNINAELSARLYYSPKWSLIFSGDFASPFYKSYKAYNNQNTSGTIYGGMQVSRKVSAGLSAKYLNSRYDYAYSQDYIIATPQASWLVSPNVALSFDVPVTFYVKTRFSKSFAPSVTARFAVEPGSLFVGTSYSKTSGTPATYSDSAGAAYILSGNMFSNYRTLGLFAGLTINLPERFFSTLQLSSYGTSYDKELVLGNSRESHYAQREDKLFSYGLDISRVMIPDRWSLSLSYNYSTNKSSGFQGLASGGYISDYNYTRPYLLVSSTLGF